MIRYNMIQYKYKIMQYDTIPYDIQHNTKRYIAVQQYVRCNTMQYNTIHFDTIQYDKMQHKTT